MYRRNALQADALGTRQLDVMIARNRRNDEMNGVVRCSAARQTHSPGLNVSVEQGNVSIECERDAKRKRASSPNAAVSAFSQVVRISPSPARSRVDSGCATIDVGTSRAESAPARRASLRRARRALAVQSAVTETLSNAVTVGAIRMKEQQSRCVSPSPTCGSN